MIMSTPTWRMLTSVNKSKESEERSAPMCQCSISEERICVHKSLWPYQAVILEGKRYSLSCIGFGLNIAPSIMQAIVDDAVWQAMSAYIDNVFINEDIASTTRVRQHLANIGLASQEPEQLQNSAQVLGFPVWVGWLGFMAYQLL